MTNSQSSFCLKRFSHKGFEKNTKALRIHALATVFVLSVLLVAPVLAQNTGSVQIPSVLGNSGTTGTAAGTTTGAGTTGNGVERLDQGLKYYAAGQFQAAILDINAFLTANPQHERSVEASYYLAESYLRNNDLNSAAHLYQKVINVGLNNIYAQYALFRVGEIPWVEKNYTLAKTQLLEFMKMLPQSAHNRFVLYYLGDIAMQNNAPSEAEYYFDLAIRFDQSLQVSPKGEVVSDAKLGLAWAKNRLGKYDESDALYRELTAGGTVSDAIVEEAYALWGMGLFERGAYEQAISTLTAFLQRFPRSEMRQEAQENLGKSYIELKRYTEALSALQQVSPKTDTSRIHETRVLFALKKTAEGEALLKEIDRTVAPQHRDKVTALKMYLAADQDNWAEYINIAQGFLYAEYDQNTQRMNFRYYDTPSVGDAEKLSQDNFLRICAGLSYAYAKTGDAIRAQATYAAMQRMAVSGDPVLAEIVRKTNDVLSNMISDPTGTTGNDSATLLAATRKYMSYDYAGTVDLLARLLGASYTSPGTPGLTGSAAANGVMTFSYTPATGNVPPADGRLTLDSMVEACQLMVLSYAYGGDAARANATFSTMQSLCRADNAFQQGLLTQAKYKIDSIPQNGISSGGIGSGATVPGATVPGTTVPGGMGTGLAGGTGTGIGGSNTGLGQGQGQGAATSQSEIERRKTIRECRSLYRRGQHLQVERKLYALLTEEGVTDSTIADAAFLRGQALMELHREKDAIIMGTLALEKAPDGTDAPEILWMIGLAYVYLENEIDAQEYFDRIVHEYPQSDRYDGALYYQALHELRSRRGDKTKATAKLYKIYRSSPNSVYWSHATWELAYQSYLKQDYAMTDLYLQKLLTHPPDETIVDRAVFLKGRLAMELGHWEVALVAFAEVGKMIDSPLRDFATQNAAVARSTLTQEVRR